MIHVARGQNWEPSEAATQTYGFLARKGGGKTYAAGKLAEQLLQASCPMVVFDPVGNWGPGLRRSADGRGPGLPIAVLGGDHGDLELAESNAEPLAEYLAEKNASAVLDLSTFRKAERKRFVAAFAETFFHVCKRHRSVRMVVFEEAQVFAPQQAQGQERMLGAIEDIVRLGRNYGIGSMLVSQRPQSVNKEVLNQVECLFVGQLSGAHERRAIRDWIVAKGADLDKQLEELPSLEVGEFFLWSPQWLRIFQKVRILKKSTFDASSTPKLGEELAAGAMASVDVDELRGMLAPKPEPEPEPEPGLSLDLNRALESDRDDWRDRAERWKMAAGAWESRWESLRKKLRELAQFAEEAPLGALPAADLVVLQTYSKDAVDEPPRITDAEINATRDAARRSVARKQGSQKLGKAELTMLAVLQASHGPRGRAELALASLYAPKGGGFANALSKLRTAALVTGVDRIEITAVGTEALGPYPKPPRGRQLFDAWCAKVGKAARLCLQQLAGGQMSRDQLAAAAGYEASGGGFANALSKLRGLGLIEGKGHLRLSDDFQRAMR